ncbi:MAG: tripartite tricarboxylate transporter permease [Thermoflexales bacterium]|nr:tripartite tricarboxylate transporter permease [Thermoflexales bacterium]
MDTLILLLYALAGALIASLLACVPALHIYNVAALLILAGGNLSGLMTNEQMALFFLGLITGYSILNTIPSIFLSSPDDSMVFIVLPGQKYLLQGRGFEASILTGVGSLAAIAVIVAGSPLAGPAFSTVRSILSPHLGWILAAISVYMLQSEWPKSSDRRPTPLGRLTEAWTGLGAGLLTFLLSGLLGFILMYRSPVPLEIAFQNLMPAFVGLFAIPWVLLNIAARVQIPKQHEAHSIDVTPELIARGTFAGALGGSFAAFFPVVTGGIGGFLAGHATAQRDDRLFILSQGASKVFYYVGGFLLFFVPGLGMTRGGMAWMLSTVYTVNSPRMYFTAIAAVAVAGAVAFLLLFPLTRLTINLLELVPYQLVSALTLAVLVTLVFVFTGWGGLLVSLVAAGIGLIPVVWRSRRMNCMGVLLLPITLNMAGVGPMVAGWLGLV